MISCSRANLTDPAEATAMIDLLNTYATDVMGGSSDLDPYVRENLAKELLKRPTAHCFLARVDGEPAGVSICFEGFSTFSCKPLLNIHDFAVSPMYRRRGVATALLQCIEQYAKLIGCIKLTLEVLEGNHGAQKLYTTCGFEGYELAADTGKALFWQKKLNS
jgi:ribosomal protein S18 acetylase RimI-like enzyme